MASGDATSLPLKNIAYRVTFPILDADGDLVTGAAGLDSEVSKDAGTFTDCTNEATEIATSSGMYYLDLTSTEMNADTVAVIVKTSTVGAKTTPLVLVTSNRGINDLAFPTTTGRSLDVTATGAAGIDWANVENPTTSLNLSGTSTKALEPTTAGRTLDVTATGEGGIDWANIGAPTTSVNLSGTTVGTAAALTTNNDKTGYRLSATGVDDVWDEALSGHTTAGTTGKQLADISTGTAPTVGAIADAVWDEAIAGHLSSGSTGEALNSAGGTTPPTATENAEAILKLDVDTIEGTAAIHSLGSAVLKAVSRVVRAAGVETTYRTDGSTPHMSQTLTEDAGAVPVTEQTIAS